MRTQKDSSNSDSIPDSLCRLSILLGRDGIEKLRRARVAVVGLGGVGSWAAEALARSGVGTLILVDGDKVAKSDLNRQLFSTLAELGNPKAEAAARRIALISELAQTVVMPEFLTSNNMDSLFERKPDVVVDAIDRLDDKVVLLEQCVSRGVRVVSSMGAGGRSYLQGVKSGILSETEGCPLAKKLRRLLRNKGIAEHVRAVYSTEPSQPPGEMGGEPVIGSAVWVTASFGFALAGEVVRILVGTES